MPRIRSNLPVKKSIPEGVTTGRRAWVVALAAVVAFLLVACGHPNLTATEVRDSLVGQKVDVEYVITEDESKPGSKAGKSDFHFGHEHDWRYEVAQYDQNSDSSKNWGRARITAFMRNTKGREWIQCDGEAQLEYRWDQRWILVRVSPQGVVLCKMTALGRELAKNDEEVNRANSARLDAERKLEEANRKLRAKEEAERVEKCPRGATWSGTTCVCPRGSSSNGTECQCLAGAIWSSTAKECQCPAGTAWDGTVCAGTKDDEERRRKQQEADGPQASSRAIDRLRDTMEAKAKSATLNEGGPDILGKTVVTGVEKESEVVDDQSLTRVTLLSEYTVHHEHRVVFDTYKHSTSWRIRARTTKGEDGRWSTSILSAVKTGYK
jgi:hypothetical protein